jgi:hypothetical protein
LIEPARVPAGEEGAVAVTDELVGFVKEGLARGLPRPELEAALVKAGWDPADIGAAVGAFADVEFPIPVPRPRANLSARDAFLYLVLFSTLYVVAYNLGSLLFDAINHWVPDPAAAESSLPAEYLAQAIRWSVSALIVATPVFLYVSALVGRERRRDPAKRASKVRRWLTYLTLFIAAGVLVGDVIALVYNLLGGELTARFVLKATVVGGIAGSVFGYYLSDLRRDEQVRGS